MLTDVREALPSVVAVVGPTASGKSEVAEALAERLGGEIVSVDSMQVYRGLDIGTAKPSPETRARIPHHMLDLVEPEEEFSVAEFQHVGRGVVERITAAGKVAIVAGGSGLHFRALVDPLEFPPTDPELRARLEGQSVGDLVAELLAADPDAGRHVDLRNPRRVVRAVEVLRLTGRGPSTRAATPSAEAVAAYRPVRPLLVVGLDPGPGLAARVEARFDQMLRRGLLDEVAAHVDRLGVTARQAVGYKELVPVVRGEAALAQGRDAAIRASLALAKRQRTWFRRDPRIAWLPWQDDPTHRIEAVIAHLAAVAGRDEETAWTS